MWAHVSNIVVFGSNPDAVTVKITRKKIRTFGAYLLRLVSPNLWNEDINTSTEFGFEERRRWSDIETGWLGTPKIYPYDEFWLQNRDDLDLRSRNINMKTHSGGVFLNTCVLSQKSSMGERERDA